jgi:serine/threonine protein kinase
MISDSTFEHVTRGLNEGGEAALREAAEEARTRRAPMPPEATDGEPFGSYRLSERLARGGMGEVYKAWDTELGRWVALKVLRNASPALRLRFARESMRLARLSHPNVVPVYRASQHEDVPYIAMAWIEGRTLDRVEPTVRQSLEAVRTAARAIEFAHQRGVVHRDLKPQNLMLAESGHLYVLDFGLARETGEEASTVDGAVLGTPAYMAPEQARGRTDEIGPATDVYALGTTLYHLVTGAPPFKAQDVPALMLKIAGESPPPPRRLRRNLHPDIERIILTAMEKAPKDRYPGAGALADDIDRFLEGEPIWARPMTAWQRARRWFRRNPIVASSLVTALVLLLPILAASVYLVAVLQDARRWQDESLRAREERLTALQGMRSYLRALESLREGRLESALAQVDLAISWDPNVREYYLMKAEILDRMGRPDEARAARERAPPR